MELLFYEKPYTLRTSDYNVDDTLRLSSIMDVCQHIAGLHATKIGVGFADYSIKGYFWVITKLRFRFLKKRKVDDVNVLTWPSPNRRIEYYRNYVIKDLDGDSLIECETTWIVVTKDRKIVRPENVVFNSTNYYSAKLYDEPMGKLNYDIPPHATIKEHEVEYNDIDYNGHMNNAKYGDLISSFWDISGDNKYQEFEIYFHHEAVLGDTIKTYHFISDNDEIYVGMIGNEKCFTAKIIKEEK